MKCISCDSEKVENVGRDCWCTDCGVTWKEPVYNKTLEKTIHPEQTFLEEILIKFGEKLPWIIILGLILVCIYLYLNPGVGLR